MASPVTRRAMTVMVVFAATLFMGELVEVLASGETCGGTITAGSGVIRSPQYPDSYPASTSCTWVVHTSDEDIRVRVMFRLRNCGGSTLQIYDGNGTENTAPIGEYCHHGEENIPSPIESSGQSITLSFVSSNGIQPDGRGFVISYEAIDIARGNIIVWSEVRSGGGLKVNTMGDDSVDLLTSTLTGGSVRTRSTFEIPTGNCTALATSYGDQKVMFSLNHLKAIIVDIMGGGIKAFYGGTSPYVTGIAIDWLTGNVYITDAAYDWIMINNPNGTRNAIVIDEDLDAPSGLAIHPLRGFLFWTDAGSTPKVERSNLAGAERIEIATTDVVQPRGIAVDYDADKVYWVDADPSNNRIEVSDLDGGNRQTVYQPDDDKGLYDLTISGNTIYVTTIKSQEIVIVLKGSGIQLLTLNIEATPYGIATYAPNVQIPAYSPCDSNPCTFICVGTGGDGYTCICGAGQLLSPDGLTCERERLLPSPKFVVSSLSKLCHYTINLPDVPSGSLVNSTGCTGRIPVNIAVAVDVQEGETFLSVGRQIRKFTMRKISDIVEVTDGSRSVRGMAVDWLTKHLYWTDYSRGTIEVAKYDGSYRATLIDDVTKPTAIVIDPKEKYLFWADANFPGKIERAILDGTERTVIARNSTKLRLFLPTALAIDCDAKRVYYADKLLSMVESMDYHGMNGVTIFRKARTVVFDIAIFKDYLLWTELGSSGIHSINRNAREGDGTVANVYDVGEQALAIETYADTRQKIAYSPCRVNNGGCDQLCLSSRSSGRGYICKCSLGFELAEDGTTCLSDLVQADFLLVTDSFQRAIFQINLEDPLFEPNAISVHSLANAIAVSFDPVERKVYWTDVRAKTLSRAFLDPSLDGSQQEIIAFNQISVPDGIAVDSVSRLLYWTDAGTHTISVSRLDGTNRKTLIGNLQKPRAIVLQPTEGVMYWTDWGDEPTIERSYMDGSGRVAIVTTALTWPNGLALDQERGRLYWCDAGTDKIETSDLRGGNRRVLINLGANGHPYDVAVVGRYIYWTDWNAHSVLRADKMTGSGQMTVGPSDYVRPNALYAVTQTSLPAGVNQCSAISDGKRGGCSGLCLPIGSGRTCACADGYELRADGSCEQVTLLPCPVNFTSGGIESDCSPLPGNVCQVKCHDGRVPAIDEIVCLPSGRWDVNVMKICKEQQCAPLPTPLNSTPGPCPSPRKMGTMCTHTCEDGYVQTGGDRRRVCNPKGEWLGTPIVCEVRRQDTRVVSSQCDLNLAFIERPESREVGQDEVVSMACQVDNSLDTSIAWYKNGRALRSDNDIFVGPEAITIPGFQPGDEGVYACAVVSGDRECLRTEANVTFNAMAAFRSIPGDVVVNGKTHVFYCSPRSDHDYVTWLKDGRELENIDDRVTISEDSLVLQNLRESDEGKYTCVLRNRRGLQKGRAHAWLYLSEPPQLDLSEFCGTTIFNQGLRTTTVASTPADPNLMSSSDFLGAFEELSNEINLSGRIVGGRSTEKGSAPYMVRLWSVRRRQFICGGTLLNQQWVLTAAHCLLHDGLSLRPDEIHLTLGDYDAKSIEDFEMTRFVSEVVVHRDFDENNFRNDVALLRLSRTLRNFTDYIRPVCLAPPGLAARLLQQDNTGRVTGWGRIAAEKTIPRFPKEVRLPFIERDACLRTTEFDAPKSLFCAGYLNRQEDACEGDSGGPYAMEYVGRWYQLGIVSSGEGCAEEGKYGYYTNVTYFIPWLLSLNVTFASSPEVEELFPQSEDALTRLDFARKPGNMTVSVGSAVSLECIPNKHDAEVTWRIHDRAVTPDLLRGLDDGVHFSPTGLSLNFAAFKPVYAGWYGCEIRGYDVVFGLQTLRARFRVDVIP